MAVVNLGPEPPRLSFGERVSGSRRSTSGSGVSDEGLMSGIQRALEGLPNLFRTLAADFSELFGLKVALFKAEVVDSAKHYAKDAVFLGIAAAVGVITLPLLEITLALLIAWALPLGTVASLAIGFLIVTVLNGAIAGFLVMKALNDLSNRSPAPKRSLQDLERDKEWLANGMK